MHHRTECTTRVQELQRHYLACHWDHSLDDGLGFVARDGNVIIIFLDSSRYVAKRNNFYFKFATIFGAIQNVMQHGVLYL